MQLDLLQNQPLISLNPNTRINVQTKNNTVIPTPKTGRVVFNNIDTKNIVSNNKISVQTTNS